MIYYEVYGSITFTEPLTEAEANKIADVTDCKVEAGEDSIEFEGNYFDMAELVKAIEGKAVKEANLEDVEIDELFIYRNGNWRWYRKEYLCWEDVQDLVEELEDRGCKATKIWVVGWEKDVDSFWGDVSEWISYKYFSTKEKAQEFLKLNPRYEVMEITLD